MGFEFYNKTSDTVEVKRFDGVIQKWEIILELPFDSTRKRMSVIVKRKDIENSCYFVFCKGADTAILNIIDNDSDSKNIIASNFIFINLSKFIYLENLTKFAEKGLRTLCMAKRKISAEEVQNLLSEIKNININIGKNKKEEIMKLYSKIERGLSFVGASAVEDKLQEVKNIILL